MKQYIHRAQKLSWPVVAAFLLLWIQNADLAQQNIVFPTGANVIDVTQAPYNADRTGNADATDALTRAVTGSHIDGWAMTRIIYIPNGTYKVSGTIAFRPPPYAGSPHLVGQSRTGTVIKLVDGTFPLGTEAKPVIGTGSGVAQCFSRGLQNLTINTGRNNPGAYGVTWYGHNEALMTDVDIISEDGAGLVGLDLISEGGEQGPCMVRRVYVEGFDYGVKAAPLNDVVITELTLVGQRVCGVYNEMQPLYIDSLWTDCPATAVHNHTQGKMVLVNAKLNNGSPSVPAIKNIAGGWIFLRDIESSGYQDILYSPSTTQDIIPSGRRIEEWSSHGSVSLFPSGRQSLNLPRKRQPIVAWETDPNKWAFIDNYPGASATAKLQAAIDDASRTTVCLPWGKIYQIDSPVYLRGNVRRLIGGGSVRGSGSLVIADGSAPVVKVELLTCPGTATFRVVKKTTRTAIVESGMYLKIHVESAGDMFVTDNGWSPMVVSNPGANVWAWQYDAEEGTYQLEVSAGKVRVFGWKDEMGGSSANLTGGVTELLGFLNYSGDQSKNAIPQFSISGSAAFSAAMCTQTNFRDAFYDILVREQRNGQTRELLSSENDNWYHMPLYTSYDATALTPAPPRRRSQVGRTRALHCTLMSPGTHAGAAFDIRGRSMGGSNQVHSYTSVSRVVVVEK